MTRNTIRIILVIVTVAIFATSAITMAFSPKKNLKPSEYNLGITYEAAVADKKPFIAIFYSDMCSFCVQSMPEYLALADIYKNKYNFVMINTDNPDSVNLIRDYAVNGLPTIYIVDPTIDNRISIPNSIYGNLGRIRVEFDRYLRIRAMIKQ